MKYLLLIFILTCSLVGHSEYRSKNSFQKNFKLPPRPDAKEIELGGFFQLGNYQGDLNPSNFTMISTDPGLGFYVKKNPILLLPKSSLKTDLEKLNFHRIFNGALFVSYQSLSFKDQDINKLHHINPICYTTNLKRNLSFNTNVFQIGMNLEYNPFILGRSNYFAPYLVGGFSGILFNPRATYTLDGVTKTVNLRKIQTEGVKYLNLSSVINLGLGIKYVSEEGYGFGIEISQNFTQTDYLDDVSRFYPADFSKLTPEQILLSARGLEQNKDFIASNYSSSWLLNNPDVVKKYIGKRRGDSYDKDAFWNIKISYSQILNL